MGTLGATLIVLNEEKYIERAITNLLPMCKEIIIVDGGSTDRTMEVSKKYDCKIIENKFAFDFSAQRNFALRQSSCDWVVTVDADEYFTGKAISKIKDLAAADDPEVSAYSFWRKDLIDGVECGKMPQWRLLKRGAVEWSGKIHEGLKFLSGRGKEMPLEFELIHCKEFRRQLYSDKLYENITNGVDAFPSEENYELDSRTFEGI